ncbi:MAG TPA: hypothetical protein VIA18_00170 [Polyangia bacterium]|jgi:hypothetical protein|nr:hypothetical protein [Polyangia bacterium]
MALPGEPLAGQRVFVASRLAAVELFGADGLRAIGERLPEEARHLVDSALIDAPWLPERFVMAWQEAVWAGPAQLDDAKFRQWIHQTIALGFGRVRRLLVNLVTPATLCTRAAELWHEEHSHGAITAEPHGQEVLIRLREHPYTERAIARMVLAEGLRYAAGLTRAKSVTEAHHMDGDVLEVKLTWK